MFEEDQGRPLVFKLKAILFLTRLIIALSIMVWAIG